MAPQPTKNMPPGVVPKHRACDECRARKLACSKEPDGCARCKREGIPCHYSPQKPMGRPRKRRHVDDLSAEAALYNISEPGSSSLIPAQPPDTYIFDPAPPVDASLNLFDLHGGSSTSFLDLLPFGFYDDNSENLYNSAPYPPDQIRLDQSLFSAPFDSSTVARADNFEKPAPPEKAVPQDGNAWQRLSPPEQPIPSSSSDLSSTVESLGSQEKSTVKAIPSVSCGCLSSLYLAIESLARLPPDVNSAMRVARNACRVAQDVVECHQCTNSFFDDPLKPPPIQGFQNLMFLGALVPSACNAYASILEMVDDETELAIREKREIFFSLKDVGGYWGSSVADGSAESSPMLGMNKYLGPELWRKTIRSILKVDIYGLNHGSHASAASGAGHRGLKDVLEQLDETSRRRHDLMDELMASGRAPKHSQYLMSPLNHPPCPPEQRNCVKIIETARLALDRLVIA
ncbi:hypothetical protein HIM_07072 [Hirsutella minnesotensis 3608]|uniref:Zn(2)-C6 fungal-type domain-containing protein n=1 Tax=Hirsutella minnesotensis 3608 TaxID=1043627 RepID=A0A0F7ZI88_9HYPO|nr:hypothetical protein HIM_07072 [Hirsutella minnesotensis 3608]